ncbi:MAG: glycosyltransferase family 10 domain-containing protein [Paludibacter sp.]
MKTIKLSTPWNHNYLHQFPSSICEIDEYKFEINNECNVADFWVIWGGVNSEEHCTVKSGKVLYITDEAYPERQFNKQFLKQFDNIIAVRTDLNEKYNVINNFEITPWYFNKSYDELNSLKRIHKNKKISIISSDLTLLSGHKKRFAFVNKMIGHFKDKVDVFGRGFNEIPDKFDALNNYQFSIAIENNVLNDYFTEKISECFLTYTMPIYFGCPNIEEYYDSKSFIKIDIDNYNEAIHTIESAMNSNVYDNSLEYIIDSRNRYLNKYHFAPAIVSIISGVEINPFVKKNRKITIFPETKFEKTVLIKRAIKQIINNL